MRRNAYLLGAAALLVTAGVLFLAPLDANAQDKVVRVWHTETNPQSREAIANIVQRFEAAHPGIKVEAEALAWGDLESKILAALAAGSPPELSHGQPVTCAALQAQGMLSPLDDVVQAIGEENIWDQIKQVCRSGDSYYGLVHAAGTSLLIYRKDLAQEVGVSAPETWDDLLAVAEKLTLDTNGDGQPDIYGMTIPGDNLFINILLTELIKANGGGLFDAQNRPRFTESQMIETLEFIKALTAYMPPGWEGHGYRETFANMYGGKAAMMFQGYGRGASLIEQNAPADMQSTDFYDVWIKPRGPSGAGPAAQVDEEPWMLFKDSENPEEAKEFLKFFYEDENYLEYIQSVPIHFFPITKSLRQNADYQQTPMIQRWGGWLAVQEFYLDNDLVKPTMVVDWEDMDTKPFLMDVLGSGILKDMVMEVTLEDVSPEEAAARAQERAEELVKSKGFAKW
ncbi:MAG: ABC transporter substrate-binding protein [Alphaproteobacteria bacterium]